MTDTKRREAISKLISDYTAANTVSKSAARKALANEGIYTERGELRVEFGGKTQKKTSAVA